MIYAKAAKLEQIMLQQRAQMQWMKGGDQCLRVFFCKIAQRRTTGQILQINDEHGITRMEPEAVIHEFITFYQSLLGGDRCCEVMDFRYLRPWTRHILSEEESSQLIVPFIVEDVKLAVFDIADDKVPGPDRFSSGFFKEAWSVVGSEVTKAVLDFFTTGKLLKQINSTLLALIPKMDIRKAYETVEWDFLLAVLQLFDFPVVFMRWIEECITTLSFSVGLNGKPHGFFASTRGLRQGLDYFGNWSGLRLNVQKSYLILSRSTQGLKEEMLAVLEFQKGHLPMRYLGLPLISSRLSLSDCHPLLQKIDARIVGWEGLSLSYAVRVQIIKSVLTSLSVYWAKAFILPKGVIKDIEKRLWKFLWKGTGDSGYAKVAWKEVCKPVAEGGQGLPEIGTLNRALMCKKLCDVIWCDRTSIWVDWIYNERLRDTSIWIVSDHRGSWAWRKIVRLQTWLRPIVEYSIGDGIVSTYGRTLGTTLALLLSDSHRD
ncbi:UNVERIFIED_CONTAM: hypothetical protein Sindi_1821900 [Sesamum indicum]